MGNNKIGLTEAVNLCIDERAILQIANLCRAVEDCKRDNCPFCFSDSCGFTFCAFLTYPALWAECIDLEEV